MANTSPPKASDYSSFYASEQRNCFGLAWFTDLTQAEAFGRVVEDAGIRVVGGFYDGMLCGRASQYDYTKDGVKFYAVMD